MIHISSRVGCKPFKIHKSSEDLLGHSINRDVILTLTVHQIQDVKVEDWINSRQLIKKVFSFRNRSRKRLCARERKWVVQLIIFTDGSSWSICSTVFRFDQTINLNFWKFVHLLKCVGKETVSGMFWSHVEGKSKTGRVWWLHVTELPFWELRWHLDVSF